MYETISLFSGGMGLDIGLRRAGLNIVICQDFDTTCVRTIRANGHRVLEGDIRDITAEQLLREAHLNVGEAFLVCGGPPCQPFSTAGKRLGINDPRGSLFMDFIRIIDYARPRFFVMENVRGLMSAPLRPGPGKVIDVVLGEFAKLGYRTTFDILNAVNYGVPQFRERFVMIGSRDGEDIFLPRPTHFMRHQSPDYRWRTLGDALDGLCDTGEHGEFSAARKEFLRMVPEGGNWRDLPRDVVEEAMGGAYRSGGGKVGFYRRLSFSQPSPTLTTSPAQKATMLCHPTEDRPLSVREYARIQQFPDDWVFEGTTSEKYRQIGNAVPVGLGEAIGQSLVATATGKAVIKTRRYHEDI